jgi:hypothetical protein
MANSIRLKLDTSKYAAPTQADINAAKQFILQREEYARMLESRVDEILNDAAERIVIICYRYDVDPKYLYFGSGFNEQMMSEISDVMDEIEQAIIDIINEYSTIVTKDKDRTNALLLWIASLGRGDMNLQGTLDAYLYKFMKDLEAAIAALRYANATMAGAVTKVKSHLHSIYTMPEVLAAFKEASTFAATYIQSKGVQKGGVGLSNNGSTNVTKMARITLQMAWMRSYRMDFEESGAVGFYVLRGSSYPCSLCDSKVGFHVIDETDYFPPFHPNCCCYVIPIQGIE